MADFDGNYNLKKESQDQLQHSSLVKKEIVKEESVQSHQIKQEPHDQDTDQIWINDKKGDVKKELSQEINKNNSHL